jgi:ABC-type transport system involved in multi-copper enzyme maturation permease subunit
MPAAGFAGVAIVYAIIYVSVLLAVATFIFSRRNFK